MLQHVLLNAFQLNTLNSNAAAQTSGDIPEKEREELRQIITTIFEQKMNKHSIK